jgi:hypothetical protein
MMTNIKNIAIRLLQPVVLAVLMLFSTPVFGLLHIPSYAPIPIVAVNNETIVFKTTMNASVAFKG